MLERIKYKSRILAIIIRNSYEQEGIDFFTPENFSQQIGYMKRPSGYEIKPHLHIPVKREVSFTKEVLFIKQGRVRVDFYNDSEEYIESKIISQGDVILLAFGGHGFKILEDAEIIEVKQGPYAGEKDKKRFDGISSEFIKIKK